MLTSPAMWALDDETLSNEILKSRRLFGIRLISQIDDLMPGHSVVSWRGRSAFSLAFTCAETVPIQAARQAAANRSSFVKGNLKNFLCIDYSVFVFGVGWVVGGIDCVIQCSHDIVGAWGIRVAGDAVYAEVEVAFHGEAVAFLGLHDVARLEASVDGVCRLFCGALCGDPYGENAAARFEKSDGLADDIVACGVDGGCSVGIDGWDVADLAGHGERAVGYDVGGYIGSECGGEIRGKSCEIRRAIEIVAQVGEDGGEWLGADVACAIRDPGEEGTAIRIELASGGAAVGEVDDTGGTAYLDASG